VRKNLSFGHFFPRRSNKYNINIQLGILYARLGRAPVESAIVDQWPIIVLMI